MTIRIAVVVSSSKQLSVVRGNSVTMINPVQRTPIVCGIKNGNEIVTENDSIDITKLT